MKKDNKFKVLFIISIVIIIILIGVIIIQIKNTEIRKQKILKQQLEETTTDNAYVLMEKHTSEVEEKEQKLISFKSTIANAITDLGVETEVNADVDTMVSNIRTLLGESNINGTLTIVCTGSLHIWSGDYTDAYSSPKLTITVVFENGEIKSKTSSLSGNSVNAKQGTTVAIGKANFSLSISSITWTPA